MMFALADQGKNISSAMASYNSGIIIDVAVGLVISEGSVLIAKRHFYQHQGERWEFPGGKIESGETTLEALVRELKEEVALDVIDAQFLFSLEHEYDERAVRLHVFKVIQFEGVPAHQEGQLLIWHPIDTLISAEFPAANQAIVAYLKERN